MTNLPVNCYMIVNSKFCHINTIVAQITEVRVSILKGIAFIFHLFHKYSMDDIGPGGKYYRYSQIAVVIVALTFLTLISFLSWPYLSGSKNQTPATLTLSSNNISKPTPPPETPIPYTLPSGSQTYRFSHGSEVKGPKMSSVTIDPLDPQNGAAQTFTIDLESESPVTNADIIIITDNKENSISLKLIEGDPLKGTYQGSWQVNDSFDTKYAARYILKSEKDTYDQVMYMR